MSLKPLVPMLDTDLSFVERLFLTVGFGGIINPDYSPELMKAVAEAT